MGTSSIDSRPRSADAGVAGASLCPARPGGSPALRGAPMVAFITKLVRSTDEDGQGLAEYALILALIAIVAIVALIFLGNQISGILDEIAQRTCSAAGRPDRFCELSGARTQGDAAPPRARPPRSSSRSMPVPAGDHRADAGHAHDVAQAGLEERRRLLRRQLDRRHGLPSPAMAELRLPRRTQVVDPGDLAERREHEPAPLHLQHGDRDGPRLARSSASHGHEAVRAHRDADAQRPGHDWVEPGHDRRDRDRWPRSGRGSRGRAGTACATPGWTGLEVVLLSTRRHRRRM